MKVFLLNSTYKNGGSTGRIVFDLMKVMEKSNVQSFAAYGIASGIIPEENSMLLQSNCQLIYGQIQSRLFARHGFYNVNSTKKLLSYIDEVKPNILHLHNLHGYYVHCGMLFDYIKNHHIPVVWTLHDCWAFTGWCAYFDYAGCEKWKTHCLNCPSKNDYPKAWITSRAKSNFDLKMKTFTGVENLVLVTPSEWLSKLTRESYLNEYPVKVINNGVDTKIFKPTANSLKKDLGIEGKKMFLAVAGGLEKRKGSEFLLKLPTMLHDDEVLVILGIKKNQIGSLPKLRCIGIPYTNSVEDLASIYSAADVFINTTLEDNFPTTNLEAMACGTPVVTFNTGGSIEPVLDHETPIISNNIIRTNVGGVVTKGDVTTLLVLAREYIKKDANILSTACVEKINVYYNKDTQYDKYIKLYQDICS